MIHTPQFHHPHHPHHRSLQVRTTLILFSSIYRYLLLDISVRSCVILEKLAFSLTFFFHPMQHRVRRLLMKRVAV